MSIRIWSVVLIWMLAVWVYAKQTSSIISDIVIRGNQRVNQQVILAQMRTKVGQPYVQDQLDRDRQAIQDLGFFSAVQVTPLPTENGKIKVTVDVQEYPVVKEIRILGNRAVPTNEILKVVTIKPGDVFNEKVRQESSNAIRELYSKKGFFLAGIDKFDPMEGSPGTLQIELVESRVGTVSVQGNRTTKTWVIRRLIKTKSGDTFSQQKWLNDLRRLYNTQWFENVDSKADPTREFGQIDLTAVVKEARTGVFNVGVQLDPTSSLAGLIRLSETNLRGTGQGLDLNFVQSTLGDGASVDLNYTNPFYDAKDTTMRLSLYSHLVYRFQSTFSSNTPLNTNDFNERRTGASLGFSRPLTDYLNLGFSGKYEKVRTNNVGSTPYNSFIQQDGTLFVGTFGGTLNRRDVDLDPARGDWLHVEIDPGYSDVTNVGGAIAGERQSVLGGSLFTKGIVEYRKYWSPDAPRGLQLDAPKRVLATRVRLGSISGNVPFFEQFFAGGADTLRGYDEDRFWGKNMALMTVEYRQPIQKSFNVIGFVDYGGAWGGYGTVNGFSQTQTPNFQLGFGVGLGFRTPLGPIRVDLGFNQQLKSRAYFQIATSF